VIAFTADANTPAAVEMLTVDATSGHITLLSSAADVALFQWSRDGQWVGFLSGAASQNSVLAAHADGSSLSTLSGSAAPSATQLLDSELLWSPDSQRLAFAYTHVGGAQNVTNLYAAAANGSGGQLVSDPAATNGGVGQVFAWSPDSGHVLYDIGTSSAGSYEYADTSVLGIVSAFNVTGVSTCGDIAAAWSPMGDRLAFFSQASGTSPCNLTVTAPDGSGAQMAVSTLSSQASLASLTWLADGNRILYHSTEDVLYLGFTSFATELYVAYAAGSAGIKISSNLGDTEAVYGFEEL
jgi:Tol biopolymer transport system component